MDQKLLDRLNSTSVGKVVEVEERNLRIHRATRQEYPCENCYFHARCLKSREGLPDCERGPNTGYYLDAVWFEDIGPVMKKYNPDTHIVVSKFAAAEILNYLNGEEIDSPTDFRASKYELESGVCK